MQILCIQYRHFDTWGGGGGGEGGGGGRDNGMEPYRGRKLSALTI